MSHDVEGYALFMGKIHRLIQNLYSFFSSYRYFLSVSNCAAALQLLLINCFSL